MYWCQYKFHCLCDTHSRQYHTVRNRLCCIENKKKDPSIKEWTNNRKCRVTFVNELTLSICDVVIWFVNTFWDCTLRISRKSFIKDDAVDVWIEFNIITDYKPLLHWFQVFNEVKRQFWGRYFMNLWCSLNISVLFCRTKFNGPFKSK